MSQIPELLSPAGSLEKLKMAVLYGADAVYAAGPDFGLRAGCQNLTRDELLEGVEFAHRRGAKVFVTVNGFLHDGDLVGLGEFCRFLESIGADALICSDLGVIETIRLDCTLPIHLSTQASCLNSWAAKLWKGLGVTRLILGREVSLDEARTIKEESGLPVEVFIHGSLCSSYSGHCVISNYTAGRDSNRGGCAHSCRFSYALEDGDQRARSFFMSSKDLQGLSLLGRVVKAGIDSIKIEGRMKGPLYGATVTKVYREALDAWGTLGRAPRQDLAERWEEELQTFSHRDYSTGSLLGPAGPDSVHGHREELRQRTHDVLGVVAEVTETDVLVEVKNPFSLGREVEILPFRGAAIPQPIASMKSMGGKDLMRALPGSLVRLSRMEGVERWNVVRGRC
ncbi:MAG: U32 family peptidase C-terminal domain-containing protein [Bacteriovoracales bacterium]|nr:U32 family peptidase C-terminal domain-containing protein [Bacteriovoracales bacterium]